MVLSNDGKVLISGNAKEAFFDVAMTIRAFYDTLMQRGLSEREAMEVISDAGKYAFSEEFDAMLSEKV